MVAIFTEIIENANYVINNNDSALFSLLRGWIVLLGQYFGGGINGRPYCVQVIYLRALLHFVFGKGSQECVDKFLEKFVHCVLSNGAMVTNVSDMCGLLGAASVVPDVHVAVHAPLQ